MHVELQAKVKNIRHKLIEPKGGGAYTATEITLIVENALEPHALVNLYQLQRGLPANVMIEREIPQGELALDGKTADPANQGAEPADDDRPEDDGEPLEEDAHA